MKRRPVLAALGSTAGLGAGCLGDDTSPEEDDQPDASADASDRWRDAPDVVELSTAVTGAVDFEASVRNHGTYSRPPVLTLTIMSGFDEPRAFGPFPGAAPFDTATVSRAEGGPHARLIGGSVIEVDGCWAPETTDLEDRFVALDPGDSTSETLAIVPDGSATDGDESQQTGCYRLGSYRGETTTEVVEPDVATEGDDRSEDPLSTIDLELQFELV